MDFGHHGEVVGMFEIEQELERSLAVADVDWLPSYDGRKRCQALLTVEKKFGMREWALLLVDRKILEGNVFVGFQMRIAPDG